MGAGRCVLFCDGLLECLGCECVYRREASGMGVSRVVRLSGPVPVCERGRAVTGCSVSVLVCVNQAQALSVCVCE